MGNRILITGASGNIGRALSAELTRRGADFRRLSQRPDAGAVVGDLNDRASLERAFAGVDTLYLLLPLVPNKVELARNAIAAAKAAGVHHIVRSSGAGADAKSAVSLARLQGEIDELVIASGIRWTLLRPASFMQNHVAYNAEAIRAGAYYAPHGDGATALIDVRDIAEVAAVVLTNPSAHAGRIYNLTGGEALTDAQQMAAISQAIGREVRYVDVPEQAAIDAMTQMQFPPALIDWFMSLHYVIKQGWTAGITDDVQRLTGHAPRRFAEFVRDHAAVWKAVEAPATN